MFLIRPEFWETSPLLLRTDACFVEHVGTYDQLYQNLMRCPVLANNPSFLSDL